MIKKGVVQILLSWYTQTTKRFKTSCSPVIQIYLIVFHKGRFKTKVQNQKLPLPIQVTFHSTVCVIAFSFDWCQGRSQKFDLGWAPFDLKF